MDILKRLVIGNVHGPAEISSRNGCGCKLEGPARSNTDIEVRCRSTGVIDGLIGHSDNAAKANGNNIAVNPYLTDANDWYLFHVGMGAMKPFIFQMEKTPVLEADTNPNDRVTILARTFVYSVYGRYNTGMTDPRLGVRTTNT